MSSHDNLSHGKSVIIPDEMKRAKYWADLLNKAVYKHDIYTMAKYNLDNRNKNALKEEKAKRILEEAIERYEEIFRH